MIWHNLIEVVCEPQVLSPTVPHLSVLEEQWYIILYTRRLNRPHYDRLMWPCGYNIQFTSGIVDTVEIIREFVIYYKLDGSTNKGTSSKYIIKKTTNMRKMTKICINTDFIFPKSSTRSENNYCINYQTKNGG